MVNVAAVISVAKNVMAQWLAVVTMRAWATSKVYANLQGPTLNPTPNSEGPKPTYQESLLWAGRLGARLKKLEKKDLPRG
jgi:hypothetical protein